MGKLTVAILFAIYSIYLFFKLIKILNKYENPENVFFSNTNDLRKNTNASPEEKLNAIKYLIWFFLFGTIASFLFIIHFSQ
jgi:hypothetical protein